MWTAESDGRAQPSQSWQELAGQSANDRIGDGWLEAVHPHDREQTRRTFEKAVANQTVYEVEYRIRRSDGLYRWFHVRGAPVWRSGNTVAQWMGICVEAASGGRYSIGVFAAHDEGQDQRARELTAAQVRGARGILAWSVSEISRGYRRLGFDHSPYRRRGNSPLWQPSYGAGCARKSGDGFQFS